ncbi:MAG: cell division protein FtsZ, partial [Cyanobacteriota bacterium]
IRGGSDLTLHEVNAAAEIIYEAVDPNANIIFGAVIDDRLQGEVQITVIATGFAPGEVAALQSSRVAPLKRTVTAPPIGTMPTTPSADPRLRPGLDIPEFLQRRRPPTR